MHKLDGTLVGRASLHGPAEATEEIGAGRMEIVVGIKLSDPIYRPEPRLQVLRFGKRDGAVQRDDRGVRQPEELAIQRCNLRPIAPALRVQRGDRSLQHIGAATVQCQRAIERRAADLDLPAVP